MKVIDLVKCLGMWNHIQIQDWDIENETEENTLFKGYADDCPYKLLNKTLVNPDVMVNYDNSPLNLYNLGDENKPYLIIWVTENDEWKIKD